METLQAIKARRSVRSYLKTPVEQEKIDEIVRAGMCAPNAGAFQISVVRNPGLLKRINDGALVAMKNSGVEFLMKRAAIPMYMPLYGAPALFVLSAQPDLYTQSNTSCAATNMIIAATGLGLGSCYLVTPTLAMDGENELSREVGIEEGNMPICAVIVGYAGQEVLQSSPRPQIAVNYAD